MAIPKHILPIYADEVQIEQRKTKKHRSFLYIITGLMILSSIVGLKFLFSDAVSQRQLQSYAENLKLWLKEEQAETSDMKIIFEKTVRRLDQEHPDIRKSTIRDDVKHEMLLLYAKKKKKTGCASMLCCLGLGCVDEEPLDPAQKFVAKLHEILNANDHLPDKIEETITQMTKLYPGQAELIEKHVQNILATAHWIKTVELSSNPLPNKPKKNNWYGDEFHYDAVYHAESEEEVIKNLNQDITEFYAAHKDEEDIIEKIFAHVVETYWEITRRNVEVWVEHHQRQENFQRDITKFYATLPTHEDDQDIIDKLYEHLSPTHVEVTRARVEAWVVDRMKQES